MKFLLSSIYTDKSHRDDNSLQVSNGYVNYSLCMENSLNLRKINVKIFFCFFFKDKMYQSSHSDGLRWIQFYA